MTLEAISLSNFRQYKKQRFSFSSETTVIVGGNASGKTNLLEAIFLISLGKSFKAEKDIEMVRFGEEIGRVKGVVKRTREDKKEDEEKNELEVVITKGEVMGVKTPIKKYLVNSVGKRMVDFTGRLKTVLFWPQDLELVTDSPSIRRRYLDFVLSQVDREYRRTLISYEKGLRQRNRLLEAIRDKGAHRHQLIFWDQLLIRNGEYITKKRGEYIEFVNKFQIGHQLGDFKFQTKSKFQNPNYQLFYDKSIISRQRLDQYSEEETAAGMTLVGPHRDDFEFRIKNSEAFSNLKAGNEEFKNLSHYGSRGEQRLGILWLKLGELAYIEHVSGEKPILLLDDILSELDHEHRKIIFGIIGNQQTIITTTDRHFLPESLTGRQKVIEL